MQALEHLKQVNSELYSLNRKVDKSLTEEAVIGATLGPNDTYMGTMSLLQRKSYGIDAIYRAVADYMEEKGHLQQGQVYLDSDEKILSSYAKSLITEVLKSDEDYAKILSGEIYTLNEINSLELKDSSYSNEFNIAARKNALVATGAYRNISKELTDPEEIEKAAEESFEKIRKKFGDLTVGDFMLSLSENIDKIKSISSLMSEIASSSTT